MQPTPVKQRLIGLTDLAHSIASEQATANDCDSVSEYVEWLILCQQFSKDEAASLLKLRRKRGGRGGVVVLPDNAVLPPEG